LSGCKYTMHISIKPKQIESFFSLLLIYFLRP
ncbi:MAG: hypothetical protein ACI9HJ_001656, partial [Ulvibacter sp.]